MSSYSKPLAHFFLRSALSAALLSTALFAYAALPDDVSASLKKAGIKESEVSIAVINTHTKSNPLLLHNANNTMNPASVIKLVTTYIALDRLGPDYTWKTAIFLDGTVSNGTLNGSLYIRGSGDPSMTEERIRALLMQVQAAGVQHINGDLLIDQSAYNIPEVDPGAFDGEPLRPYNVRPATLLVNYKTVAFSFNPLLAKSGDQIPIMMSPPLTGVNWTQQAQVSDQKNCGDWQKTLEADFSDPINIKFRGTLPQTCGPKTWYIAYPSPKSHALRSIGGIWQELGGRVSGKVTFGTVPSTAKLVTATDSKSLTEVVRDVNKYSNNVMAQSVFLALSLPPQRSFLSTAPISAPATLERSAEIVDDWWRNNLPLYLPPVMENGSGLSRIESISAQALANMLQNAWESSVMPEFVGSMPIASVDGTMRRSKAKASAHIKTGSVRNVSARAGYVLNKKGERNILVLFINSPKAHEARDTVDVLIDWVAEQ